MARGMDFVDAYGEVHRLDVDQLRREQAGAAAAVGSGKGGNRAALRDSYREWVHQQYLAADKATRGHLFNNAGKQRSVDRDAAKRIDPLALFSGPMSTARKYASEDLLRWWADNPRMTFAEYVANATGHAGAAARDRAVASAGRDFV